MTLDQRIEKMESEIRDLKSTLSGLLGSGLSIDRKGEIFIADAYIKDGEINAADVQAAYSLNAGIRSSR